MTTRSCYPGQRLEPPPGLVSVTRIRPMRSSGGRANWLVRCVRPCGHAVTGVLGNLSEIATRSCKRCDPSSSANRRPRHLTLAGHPASARAVARHLGITPSALCQRLRSGWTPEDASTIGRMSIGATRGRT